MMLGDAPAFGLTRQNQRRAQHSARGAASSEVKLSGDDDQRIDPGFDRRCVAPGTDRALTLRPVEDRKVLLHNMLSVVPPGHASSLIVCREGCSISR